MQSNPEMNPASWKVKVSPWDEVSAKYLLPAWSHLASPTVFALDMCSLAAADVSHTCTQTAGESGREKFFHSDTEPRCSLSLDPSLLTPFLLLLLSPPLFFPFALSLSYKDTCIPSHSMRSILPWSCNFPPLLPQGSPHFQHSQTSSLSLPFPDKLSHTAQCVYVYVHVCGVRWIRTCAGRRVQWILQAVFQLLC